MKCNEAGEFVSALCDGETISRTAAEHIGTCRACQSQLKEYIRIGAELRYLASLELPEEAKPLVWEKRHRALSTLWQKGWETMRIPRLAFALMLVGILGLGSALAIIGVSAGGKETALMLNITSVHGTSSQCVLSTEDKRYSACAGLSIVEGPGEVQSGVLSHEFRFISKDGRRIRLGVRVKFDKFDPDPGAKHPSALLDIKNLPEKQYWFEPGETLQAGVEGFGTIEVTGEWMDRMPSAISRIQTLEPGTEELRMISPLLLRDKKVVSDFQGSHVMVDKADQGISIYIVGEGLFELSLLQRDGSIEGRVRLNRISFEINGQPYVFLTETPITQSERVWILHDPNYKPSHPPADESTIGPVTISQAQH